MFFGLGLIALLAFGGYLLGVIGFFMAMSQGGRFDRLDHRLDALERRQRDALDDMKRLVATLKNTAQPDMVATPAPTFSEPAVTLDPATAKTQPIAPMPASIASEFARKALEAELAKAEAEARAEASDETSPQDAQSIAVEDAVHEPNPWSQTRASTGRTVGFEERLGTRWAVWVGGLALALGALLLVRYSIEQGFFGPAARVALGMALAGALIAAGEWLRRSDAKLNIQGVDEAYIPGVLTAAGTVAAFGSVYAAHAVYGFIGPASAFTLLGLIGAGTLLAATVHGPTLAGLGLAGSLLTPMLVASAIPNPWPAVLYLAVVTTTAQALAQRKKWTWLALAAAAGALMWGFVFASEAINSLTWVAAAMTHSIVQLAIAAYFLAVTGPTADDEDLNQPDIATLAVLAAFALLALVIFVANAGISPAAMVFTGLVIAILTFAGWRNTAAAPSVAVAGVFALGVSLAWPSLLGSRLHPVPELPEFMEPSSLFSFPLNPAMFLTFAAASALSLAVLAARRLMTAPHLRSWSSASYAGTAALLPLLMLTLVYGRLTGFNSSLGLASAAVSLGGLLAFGAATFLGVEAKSPTPAIKLGTGALAAAAIAALSLALVFALDRGYLTVALALAALGTAYMADLKKVPALRYAVVGLGLCVLGRVLWDPRIMGDSLGTTPLFNWLLFGYGVPALAFFASARLLAKDADDSATRLCDALALIFAALLAFFEIRHWLHNGNIFAPTSDHIEHGLMALTSMAFSYGLMRSRIGRGNAVFEVASMVFAGLSGLAIALGLGLVTNPYLTDDAIYGNGLINSLWLGYLIPSLAAAFLARQARGLWPEIAVACAGVMALGLLFAFVSLSVRHVFHGANIGYMRTTSDAEFWSYSAVWLGLGIVLLGYGLWRNMAEARLASAALVVLTVLKVFLWDMAGLEGALRAFSFIGLGLVLLGIGLVYQKLVFGARTGPDPSARA